MLVKLHVAVIRIEPLLGRHVAKTKPGASDAIPATRPTTGRSTTDVVLNAQRAQDRGAVHDLRHAALGERRRRSRTARRRRCSTCGTSPTPRRSATAAPTSGADGDGAAGRAQVAGLERAEQPDLPPAAVREASGKRVHPESRRATTRRSARRLGRRPRDAICKETRRLRRHRPAREQQPARAARPSISPLAFLRALKRLRPEATSTSTRTTRTTAARPRRPTTMPTREDGRSRSATSTLLIDAPDAPLRATSSSGSPSTATRRTRPTGTSASRWAKQAQYLTQGLRDRAARTRGSTLMLWFLLRTRRALAGWQSGLLTAAGKKKPAFNAFMRLPTLGRVAIRTPQREEGSDPRPRSGRRRGGRRRARRTSAPAAPFFLSRSQLATAGRRLASIAVLVCLDLAGLVLGPLRRARRCASSTTGARTSSGASSGGSRRDWLPFLVADHGARLLRRPGSTRERERRPGFGRVALVARRRRADHARVRARHRATSSRPSGSRRPRVVFCAVAIARCCAGATTRSRARPAARARRAPARAPRRLGRAASRTSTGRSARRASGIDYEFVGALAPSADGVDLPVLGDLRRPRRPSSTRRAWTS